MSKKLMFLGLAGLLAGCVSTQELPLAPNMVRLNTDASGMLFTGQAVPATMRAAAKATLDRGYTRFRLAEASGSQGSITTGATTVTGADFSVTTLNSAPTSQVGATVVMFHDSDPGAKDAFEAAQILKQYQS